MQALTYGKGMTRLNEEAIRQMIRSGSAEPGKVTLADFSKFLDKPS